MADVDDELRSEEPVAPSPSFVGAVMETVRLERRAPPPLRPPLLALVASCAALLAVAGALVVGVLGSTGHSAAGAGLVEAISRLRPYLQWATSSGARMLLASLGLVIAILVARRAERSL